MRKLRTRAWVAVLVLLAPLGAVADEVDWSNTAGGVWSVGTNWNGGDPPGALGAALFNMDQSPAYTVSLGSSENVGRMQVINDEVVLNLAGNNLVLNDPWTGQIDFVVDVFDSMAPLMVGRGVESIGHTGVLTVQGTGTLTANGMILGGTSGSTGVLRVRGVGTALQVNNLDGNGVTNQQYAIVGLRGNGELRIQEGATAHFVGIRMGRRSFAGTEATVIVEGAVQMGETLHRSTLTYGAEGLYVGHLNDAHLVVRDGALLSGTSTVQMHAAQPASITVDNATAQVGRLDVGRSTGVATLNVLNGGQMEVGGILFTALGTGGTTYVNVTGGNSLLSVTSANAYLSGISSSWASRGSTLFTVAAGGEANFERLLRVYTGSTLALDDGLITASDFETEAGAELALTLHTGKTGAAVQVLNRANGNGNVSLNSMGFTLDLAAGFTADLEDVFTVLRYEGALTGTFLGLAEGAVLSQDSFDFELSYGGGTNSAITLTVIPEPATLGLLLAAGGLLALRRRTRG